MDISDLSVSCSDLVLTDSTSYDEDYSTEKEYSVPQGAQEAARQAVDWKKGGAPGLHETGMRRALQLAQGCDLSRAEMEDIRDWFAKKEHEKKYHEIEDGQPTASLVSWKAWGGDMMMRKAERVTGERVNPDQQFDMLLAEAKKLGRRDGIEAVADGEWIDSYTAGDPFDRMVRRRIADLAPDGLDSEQIQALEDQYSLGWHSAPKNSRQNAMMIEGMQSYSDLQDEMERENVTKARMNMSKMEQAEQAGMEAGMDALEDGEYVDQSTDEETYQRMAEGILENEEIIGGSMSKRKREQAMTAFGRGWMMAARKNPNDTYDTAAKARERAEELGLEDIHSHGEGEEKVYMPGATHPKYEKALRENPPSVMGREEQYPGIFRDLDGDDIPTADDPDPLTPGNTESIEEVQLSDELRKIFDVQREYDQARQDVKGVLKDMPGEVESRTKTPYSIINKLRRKRIGGEKGITDIAGTRLIVDTHEDLEMAVEKIEAGAVGEVLEKDDHYQSEGNPYSAVHFIVSVDGKPVEIQVVTDRIHEIADAAHTPYKEGHLNADRQRELTGLAERADKGDEQAAKKIDQILQDEEELKRQLSTRKNAAPRSKLGAFGALAGAIGLTAILKS